MFILINMNIVLKNKGLYFFLVYKISRLNNILLPFIYVTLLHN